MRERADSRDDPFKDVCASKPGPVKECRLHDGVHAPSDQLCRVSGRRFQARSAPCRRLRLGYRLACRSNAVDVGLLDSTTPFLKVPGEWVLVPRYLKSTERGITLKEHTVRAVQEPDEVGCSVYELAVDPLHDVSLLPNDNASERYLII